MVVASHFWFHIVVENLMDDFRVQKEGVEDDGVAGESGRRGHEREEEMVYV